MAKVLYLLFFLFHLDATQDATPILPEYIKLTKKEALHKYFNSCNFTQLASSFPVLYKYLSPKWFLFSGIPSEF